MHETKSKKTQTGGPTPPVKDPCEVYPQVPGIRCKDFQLSPEGLSPEQRTRALKQLHDYEWTQKAHFLGYQANQAVDFEDLAEYLKAHVNNLGDPFQSGNFTVNSKFMERAVLDFYASLWRARWPHESKKPVSGDPDWKDSYWGYVLSMGCTEGNVYGLWNGRDYLAGRILLLDPQAEERAKKASLAGRPAPVMRRFVYHQAKPPQRNPNAYTPVAFYSQDTHYSIVKAVRVLAISTFNELGSGKFPCPLKYPDDYPAGYSEHYLDDNKWPLEAPSNEDGSIHIPSLTKLVECFAAQGYPILVNFNYGSTFKGAYDDVKAGVEALTPILRRYKLYEREVEYGPGKTDTRNGFWFHVDGALGAAYMPFLEMAMERGLISKPVPDFVFPVFDFRLKDIHSIAMSGHKWIGAPWPCGVYITKVKHQLQPPDDPMYLGSLDSTFAGSRNGFSAMILWDYLAKNSHQDQMEKAVRLEKVADYACTQLLELQKRLGHDLWVERSPLALTIRFRAANDDIVFKYSLSGEELYVGGEKRAYSHIFIMDHVTEKLIDELVQDLANWPDSFAPQPAPDEAAPERSLAGAEPRRLMQVPHLGRGFK